MTNVVKMLLMDLMVIYKVYQNHIVEMLDKLLLLEADQIQNAWETFKNFIRLTY